MEQGDYLRLWDPRSEEVIHEHNFHEGRVITNCLFSPDGNSYFSFGRDNQILQHEIRIKSILHSYLCDSEPTSM